MPNSYNLDKSKLFDDLVYVYKSTHGNPPAGVTTSKEIDLDLPRGYVAKIRDVIFTCLGIEALANSEGATLEMALINDPDDEDSYEIPDDTVKHDVIAGHKYGCEVKIDTTNGVGVFFGNNPIKEINFQSMGVDVISARNMRFNVNNGGANAIVDCECEIYYTIEPVKGEGLLNLLDIL